MCVLYELSWNWSGNVFAAVKYHCSVLFCSLAVLDPRVGLTMDALTPFIPVLCHSDCHSRFHLDLNPGPPDLEPSG